jgi:protein-disulfide isomerase
MPLKNPDTSKDHALGPLDAPVTLIEYGDYQCPYCGLAAPVVAQLVKSFGDQLRVAFRHFPLTEVHPMAGPAAETAEFAGAHGRFWPMHEALYANQAQLGLPLFLALATALKLSAAELETALEAGTFAPEVQADFIDGVRSGVNGTPTFFINGVRHDGGFSFPELSAAIQAALLETAG